MRKNYTSNYKSEAVLEVLRKAESLNEIAERLEVHPNMLGRWKKTAIKNLHIVFEDTKGDIKRIHEAEKKNFTHKLANSQASLFSSKKCGINV